MTMRVATAFVILLAGLALFADFLSPNPPGRQHLDRFYHPPAKVHCFDQNGMRGPFIRELELRDALNVRYLENPAEAHPLQFFFKGYRYRLLGLIETDRHLIGRSEEPPYFPLGSDELGRDVLARTLVGARTSLLVVALGVLVYAMLGLTVGAAAGLMGGWVDSLLMRLSEFVLALPALYVLLALRSLLPHRLSFAQSLILMVGAIAAIAWPPMARAVRGLILQLRNSAYVEASISMGGTRLHVFRRHMLPELAPLALAQMALSAPVFLLGEIVLSFLNIGIGSGESWGTMLRGVRNIATITDFWWTLTPFVMIFVTLLCLNLLGGRGSRSREREQAMRI